MSWEEIGGGGSGVRRERGERGEVGNEEEIRAERRAKVEIVSLKSFQF